MARVKALHRVTFRPGQGYKNEPIVFEPGVIKEDFPEEHLQDDYVRHLVDTGSLVVLGKPDAVEIAIADMTVKQLTDAIALIKPDFDFKGLKVKADYVRALTDLKAAQAPEETK